MSITDKIGFEKTVKKCSREMTVNASYFAQRPIERNRSDPH